MPENSTPTRNTPFASGSLLLFIPAVLVMLLVPSFVVLDDGSAQSFWSSFWIGLTAAFIYIVWTRHSLKKGNPGARTAGWKDPGMRRCLLIGGLLGIGMMVVTGRWVLDCLLLLALILLLLIAENPEPVLLWSDKSYMWAPYCNWILPLAAFMYLCWSWGSGKMKPDALETRGWWRSLEMHRCLVIGGLLGIAGLIWDYLPIPRFASFQHPGTSDPWVCTNPEFSLLASVLIPILMYCIVFVFSMQSFPRKAISSGERRDRNSVQRWVDRTYRGYLVAFVAAVTSVIWLPGGIGTMISGWLYASCRDANFCHFLDNQVPLVLPLPGQGLQLIAAPYGAELLDFAVKTVLCAAVIVFLWRRASRLSGSMTVWIKNTSGRLSAEIGDQVLRALRMPRTSMPIKRSRPFWRNAASTLVWLCWCYFVAFLAALAVECRGVHDILYSLFHPIMPASAGAVADHSNFMIFKALVAALYFAVPLAVTGAVMLPYRRRRQLVTSPEGMLLPDGPSLGLGFRMFKLWSDFASVDLSRGKKNGNDAERQLVIRFHTGGGLRLKVSQLSRSDMEKFLSAIDENALDCAVSEEVLDLRARLRTEDPSSRKAGEFGGLASQQFQSTIFVPHQPGAWLPDCETRVVRLLASRPLSCVYLVRTAGGRLGIAKQFFLADENEQTKSLRKCLDREYELLKRLEHPTIAKVLDLFHRDESTYLLIEHASGIDLRNFVEENGACSEATVINWALRICDIMIYLHSQDPPIIHRDLTPDNIVLAEDGSLRLIDFGAAHQFLQGITGTIIGKQCYVPPEQLQGRAEEASDIYSFGCTLHFLLTGEEPVALTRCQPSSKADVSSELDALVMACTEFSPADRPSSFQQVKERLFGIPEASARKLLSGLRRVIDVEAVRIPPVSDFPACVLFTAGYAPDGRRGECFADTSQGGNSRAGTPAGDNTGAAKEPMLVHGQDVDHDGTDESDRLIEGQCEEPEEAGEVVAISVKSNRRLIVES